MRKMICLIAGLLIFGTTSSRSSDQRNFWLLNNTGYTVHGVYVSAHTSTTWGSDVLGDATLAHGMGTVIYFYGARSTCVYDFRIVYSDGSTQDYLQGRNLCVSHAIQFNEHTNDAF